MNNIIINYFNSGYTYIEIVNFLKCCHSINISVRTLKRILNSLGLKRKNQEESSMEDICYAIDKEITGSGCCLGYKSLWKRLVQTYGLKVKRNTILNILRIIDVEGINSRKKQKFRRRKYVVPGPNFVWHVDGYDKLKPYGFAIHAAVDGFSRKILWLYVGTSNNNPKIIAHYYLETIKKLKLIPNILRTDKGTENSIMGALHCFLRNDNYDGTCNLNGFIQGKSTSNQKIESYWSQLRRSGIDWWISFFKDLRDSGQFNNGNELHVECLRYCFGSLIQFELNQILEEWNSHRIRKQKNIELPCGKPNVLYFIPSLSNAKNYAKSIDANKLENLSSFVKKSEICSATFIHLLSIIKPSATVPTSVVTAIRLYKELVKAVSAYET